MANRAVDIWGDMCSDTAVWQSVLERDGFGKPIRYTDPQTFLAHRIFSRQRVAAFSRAVKGEGAEVISGSQIIILDTPDIQYEDLVYCEGDTPPYPSIVNIERHSDELGPLYVKVIMGSGDG